MDLLLDKLDETVEAALHTLFPPADTKSASKDAQQRAQDFVNQVSAVHAQFAEIKSKMDEHPGVASTQRAILEKEITDLREDIQLKTNILDKYRKRLGELSERLDNIGKENRVEIEGIQRQSPN